MERNTAQSKDTGVSGRSGWSLAFIVLFLAFAGIIIKASTDDVVESDGHPAGRQLVATRGQVSPPNAESRDDIHTTRAPGDLPVTGLRSKPSAENWQKARLSIPPIDEQGLSIMALHPTKSTARGRVNSVEIIEFVIDHEEWDSYDLPADHPEVSVGCIQCHDSATN